MSYVPVRRWFVLTSSILLSLGLAACGGSLDRGSSSTLQPAAEAGLETAIFAAGCFWCVEEAFDPVPGVVETTSGFVGGHAENPTYEQVVRGGTGHAEAVLVTFDPKQVTYEELLAVFWRNVDPTDAGGQFCDRGSAYRSGIFYLSDVQARQARASKRALEHDPQAPSPIVTEITAATPFYRAEDYHQGYYQRNPLRYSYYKSSCGRAARLAGLWGEAG